MHSWMSGKHNDSWFVPYQFWVPLQNPAHILSSWLKEKLAADIIMHKINSNILLCVWNNLSLLYISTSKCYHLSYWGNITQYQVGFLFAPFNHEYQWNHSSDLYCFKEYNVFCIWEAVNKISSPTCKDVKLSIFLQFCCQRSDTQII